MARKANSIHLLYLFNFQPLANLAWSTNIIDQTEFFSFVWRMSTYDVTTADDTKVGLVKTENRFLATTRTILGQWKEKHNVSINLNWSIHQIVSSPGWSQLFGTL